MFNRSMADPRPGTGSGNARDACFNILPNDEEERR